ncbi:hypothetical protein JCM8097_000325 [Rhodosporidiobolus ruineniae]
MSEAASRASFNPLQASASPPERSPSMSSSSVPSGSGSSSASTSESPVTSDASPGSTATVTTEKVFEEAIDDWVANKHSKAKQDKCLIDKRTYEIILKVLRNPTNTKNSTAQGRHWAKQGFRLGVAANNEDPLRLYYTKATRKGLEIARRDEIYSLILAEHLRLNHRGRDATWNGLKDRWSHLPKALVAKFGDLCPTCQGRAGPKRSGGKRTQRKGKSTSVDASSTPREQRELSSPASDTLGQGAGGENHCEEEPVAGPSSSSSRRKSSSPPLGRSISIAKSSKSPAVADLSTVTATGETTIRRTIKLRQVSAPLPTGFDPQPVLSSAVSLPNLSSIAGRQPIRYPSSGRLPPVSSLGLPELPTPPAHFQQQLPRLPRTYSPYTFDSAPYRPPPAFQPFEPVFSQQPHSPQDDPVANSSAATAVGSGLVVPAPPFDGDLLVRDPSADAEQGMWQFINPDGDDVEEQAHIGEHASALQSPASDSSDEWIRNQAASTLTSFTSFSAAAAAATGALKKIRSRDDLELDDNDEELHLLARPSSVPPPSKKQRRSRASSTAAS